MESLQLHVHTLNLTQHPQSFVLLDLARVCLGDPARDAWIWSDCVIMHGFSSVLKMVSGVDGSLGPGSRECLNLVIAVIQPHDLFHSLDVLVQLLAESVVDRTDLDSLSLENDGLLLLAHDDVRLVLGIPVNDEQVEHHAEEAVDNFSHSIYVHQNSVGLVVVNRVLVVRLLLLLQHAVEITIKHLSHRTGSVEIGAVSFEAMDRIRQPDVALPLQQVSIAQRLKKCKYDFNELEAVN